MACVRTKWIILHVEILAQLLQNKYSWRQSHHKDSSEENLTSLILLVGMTACWQVELGLSPNSPFNDL